MPTKREPPFRPRRADEPPIRLDSGGLEPVLHVSLAVNLNDTMRKMDDETFSKMYDFVQREHDRRSLKKQA